MLHRVPLFLLATLAPAQDTPLRELPYTPSLDLTAIDKSVNPCENLYQFACGGWIKKNPIPPDQGGWDVYAKLTADNERYLWGLLDAAAKPSPNRSAIERQTGDFFSACMDEPLAQKLAATPIQPMLDRIAAMKSVREIAAFAGRHHRDWVNRGLLFNPSSDPDFDDSSKVIAFLNGG